MGKEQQESQIGPISICGVSTTNIRLDIACNSHPDYGVSDVDQVIAALREFADKLESGVAPRNNHVGNSVEGISVQYH